MNRRRHAPLSLSRRIRARLGLLILSSAVLAGVSLVLPPARITAHTARLMPAFFAQAPAGLGKPDRSGIRRQTLSAGADVPGAVLHLYAPLRGRHPALVISLGVDPAPPDDPRVVRLLDGFARAGIVAVLVESPALNQLRVDLDAPELLVRAFQITAMQPSVDPRRVGLLGFSVGGSLVLLAASDPRIAAQVRLVEAFGAYHSLRGLSRAALTRTIHVGAGNQRWQPDPLSLRVIRLNLIDRLSDPTDRDLLEQSFLVDPPSSPPSAGLSRAGQTVVSLLTAGSDAEFDAAFAELPREERRSLEQLSPEFSLAAIRAPVYVMVDAGDPLVPFVESRAIAAGLRATGRMTYFSEFDIFRHVDPTRGGNPLTVVRDLLRLFLHVSAVLQRLDQPSAP